MERSRRRDWRGVSALNGGSESDVDAERSDTFVQQLMSIVSASTGVPLSQLSLITAIDQDLRVSGGDVEDLIHALADVFGAAIYTWPWGRFAEGREGLSLLFPLLLLKQLISWPMRGSFAYPSRCERLEIGHIAKAIAAGHWVEP